MHCMISHVLPLQVALFYLLILSFVGHFKWMYIVKHLQLYTRCSTVCLECDNVNPEALVECQSDCLNTRENFMD